MSVCVYHLPSVPVTELLSIRSYLQGLESCSYCHRLCTLGVVNSFIMMKSFHLVWCLCKPIHNPHNHSMNERSPFLVVSKFSTIIPSCTLFCACIQFLVHLCGSVQLVHFTFLPDLFVCMSSNSSMHSAPICVSHCVQCMEKVGIKKVLTGKCDD